MTCAASNTMEDHLEIYNDKLKKRQAGTFAGRSFGVNLYPVHVEHISQLVQTLFSAFNCFHSIPEKSSMVILPHFFSVPHTSSITFTGT